ncbi:hypothetical protein XA26_27260 [Mycolicibacterium fortuitum]|uniref:Helix-turn-helix domain-containing protein n=1 Tax=Mycolicibacterium fortuitum TaxID=1766 RepID=A0A0N9XRW8_MYCFO|nr:hypothetical protein XA26_27260 [Mycolicibacterium fortuitum]
MDPAEVVWFAAALDLLVKYSKRAGCVVPSSVPTVRSELQTFLDSRADSLADATTRPPRVAVLHPDGEWIDVEEAAQMLGVSADAVRKSCRTGRFVGVARKWRGRWLVPAESLELHAGGKGM